MQSQGHMFMDQTQHILKMAAAYLKNIKYLSTDTRFRTDCTVESEISNVNLSPPEKKSILKRVIYQLNSRSIVHHDVD